jgi:mono/diheme cytochrome c family protein
MAQTWQVPRPSAGLMPNPSAGKKLFDKHCANCHGADLKGTKLGPPFLHPYYVSSHHGDVAFQLAAKNGVRAHHWQFGDMQPVPGVTPDDVAHITAYIRYQQRLAGIE